MRSSGLDGIRPEPGQPIVVLTGAGISKESGLDTFRDADGIWSKVRIEDVATYEAFAHDPRRVHAFYNERRRGLLNPTVQPNAAHRALARLERDWPGQVLVVTQNIDDLHERAGSKNLIHMHGELFKVACEHCRAVLEWREDLSRDMRCPDCSRAAGLRPHVVWFGEMPLEMERIYQALGAAGLFVSIGTSGNVYPAAGFVSEIRAQGTPSIELNLEPSEGTSLFTRAIHGPASQVVPAFVDNLLVR
ncbi:MAG: NAD-dependent protein deacylase [Alphaproteobacteria bacterium]|nr:NAD-dependent protein deacylase [Alphaproteobacteria bacterium]